MIGKHLFEGCMILFSDHLIGIEGQNPIAPRRFQGNIAGSGKVVPPLDVIDPCAENTRNICGTISGAGIDQNDLRSDFLDRIETGGQKRLFVFCDHADRQTAPGAGFRRNAQRADLITHVQCCIKERIVRGGESHHRFDGGHSIMISVELQTERDVEASCLVVVRIAFEQFFENGLGSA